MAPASDANARRGSEPSSDRTMSEPRDLAVDLFSTKWRYYPTMSEHAALSRGSYHGQLG